MHDTCTDLHVLAGLSRPGHFSVQKSEPPPPMIYPCMHAFMLIFNGAAPMVYATVLLGDRNKGVLIRRKTY
jgi:hypothetical protein